MEKKRPILLRNLLAVGCGLVFLSALALVQTGCGSGKAEDKKDKKADKDKDDEFGDLYKDKGAKKDSKPNPAEVKRIKETASDFFKRGGTVESEKAVQLGLRWLFVHQGPAGNWSMNGFPQDGKCNCQGIAQKNDMAATAFGVWPFLARGETHRGSEKIHQYTKTVEQGIKYLINHQGADGNLFGDADMATAAMYTHGLCTIVLCEDYQMTGDPYLEKACKKAIDFILKAQDMEGGGWRYKPQMKGDMSVVSWQLMALKTGQKAGLAIPSETTEKALKFMSDHSLKDNDGYFYRLNDNGQMEYMVGSKPDHPVVMTAAGMLCRQYLVTKGNLENTKSLNSAEMRAGVDRLWKDNPPKEDVKNIYYYYYATQVIFNIGGEPWKTWNADMRDLLVRTQDKGDDAKYKHQKGSWSPKGDQFETNGGRIMTTSLSLLTLEVYYRFLGISQKGDLGVSGALDGKK